MCNSGLEPEMSHHMRDFLTTPPTLARDFLTTPPTLHMWL